MSSHDDETGAPCTRHLPVSQDSLLTYAAIGSRVSSFHHDIASKLQSLMMAVDEIHDVGGDDVRAAAATALASLHELNAMLAVNRALAKPPQRRPTSLREILNRAAERHGVKLKGEVPDVSVNVALPSIAHALDLLLDMLAGPLKGPRTVAVVVTGTAVTLSAEAAFEPNNEHIALSAFLLAREGGTLRCNPTGFVATLPV